MNNQYYNYQNNNQNYDFRQNSYKGQSDEDLAKMRFQFGMSPEVSYMNPPSFQTQPSIQMGGQFQLNNQNLLNNLSQQMQQNIQPSNQYNQMQNFETPASRNPFFQQQQQQQQEKTNQNNKNNNSQNSANNVASSMASFINKAYQNNTFSPLPSVQLKSYQCSSLIKEGMIVVCAIDNLILKKYYAIKNKIFNSANLKSQTSDNCSTNQDWLKNRMGTHFQDPLATLIQQLIDCVEVLKQKKLEENYTEISLAEMNLNLDLWMQLENEVGGDEDQLKKFLNQLISIITTFLTARLS